MLKEHCMVSDLPNSHAIDVDFITAKIQQGLLADKKHEGRCSSDYFVFTVCEIHFSCFIETVDSKGISRTLKKILRQPDNALTLQVSLSLLGNTLLTLQVYFTRSNGH